MKPIDEVYKLYICPECGEEMEFEDEYEDILVCANCGNSMDLEEYDGGPDWDWYPTKDEIIYSDEDE